MGTKIGILRDEFLRIGCTQGKDPLIPPLSVSWNFAEVTVCGKHIRRFDYDMLREILSTIPDMVGEDFFWDQVNATDFTELANRLNEKMIETWRRTCRAGRRRF